MDLDVVVLGTGLTESIVAAALSKAGYKVGHVDANPYYGADDASLSVDEIIKWAEERSGPQAESAYLAAQQERYTDVTYTGSIPPQSRQYALSLCPTIIPSIGPLIDTLIASGVSRYGGFKLLEQVALYESPGVAKPVPGNKEDIFKNKQLSLLHKRRLMRFLMFAGGDFEDKPELQGNEEIPFTTFLKDKFSLDSEAVKAIAFAIAFCVSESDATLHALQRIRKYLRSTGRYGPSPFLFGHYGGVGEIAQGFCRTAAVAGATYILGRNVLSSQMADLNATGRRYALQLEDVEESVECDVLVTSDDYSKIVPQSATVSPALNTAPPAYSMARCIAILDQPLSFSNPEAAPEIVDEPVEGATLEENPSPPPQKADMDTAVLVFPPGSVAKGSSNVAVHALMTGEASMSCPKGKWVLYLSLPLLDDSIRTQSAEELLRPYLDAALSLTSQSSGETINTLFTVYYKQHPRKPSSPLTTTDIAPLVSPPSDAIHLPEIGDSLVSSAEATFWQAVEQLKAAGCRPQTKEGDEVDAREVDGMWPPLEYVDEDQEDW